MNSVRTIEWQEYTHPSGTTSHCHRPEQCPNYPSYVSFAMATELPAMIWWQSVNGSAEFGYLSQHPTRTRFS